MKLRMVAVTCGVFTLLVLNTSLVTSAKAQDLTARVQANGSDGNGGDHACSLRTLRGFYGSIATGTLMGEPQSGPIAILTQGNYDGAGRFTRTLNVVNVNGNTFTDEKPENGSYTVNPDCTGTQTIYFANGDLITASFVIVKHGREIVGIFTALGYTVTFDSKKE
ncbi:MAG: hypothetical protein ACR2JB_20145 [Bryobacteraceae bacterium]